MRVADSQEIMDYISRLRKQSKDIEKAVVELAIYSDGSISIRDAWEMNFEERNLAIKVITNVTSERPEKTQVSISKIFLVTDKYRYNRT